MEKVLFFGDSITDSGEYVNIIDTYLLLNNQHGRYKIDNIGLSSENCCGLTEVGHPFPRPNINNRIEGILQTYVFDSAVIMYGINDGIYSPFDFARFSEFKRGIRELVSRLKESGKKIYLCTPTYFDKLSTTGKLVEDADGKYGFGKIYADYDRVMQEYAKFIKTEMSEEVDKVIDIHTAMKVYAETKHTENKNYSSGDGVHPKFDMSIVIANTILNQAFDCKCEIFAAATDKNFLKLFKLVNKRNQLLHKYYKEKIGHTCPWKDKALPKSKLNAKVKALDSKIFAKSSREISKMQLKWTKNEKSFFDFEGYKAVVIIPKNPTPQRRWILRTEFLGAYPFADKQALERGYHIAYLNMTDSYGAQRAIKILGKFCKYVINSYNLNAKCIALGMSRGGLSAVNLACAYNELVAGLLLIAPVVSIRSWPMGSINGEYSKQDTEKAKQAYKVNDFGVSYEQFIAMQLNYLQESKMPIFLLSGDNDKVVPYEENGALIKDFYSKSQDCYKEFIAHGLGHEHIFPKNSVDFEHLEKSYF